MQNLPAAPDYSEFRGYEFIRQMLRADAIAIGQRLEAAKVDGARMRQINALISEHVVAWQRLHNFEMNEVKS